MIKHGGDEQASARVCCLLHTHRITVLMVALSLSYAGALVIEMRMMLVVCYLFFCLYAVTNYCCSRYCTFRKIINKLSV